MLIPNISAKSVASKSLFRLKHFRTPQGAAAFPGEKIVNKLTPQKNDPEVVKLGIIKTIVTCLHPK